MTVTTRTQRTGSPEVDRLEGALVQAICEGTVVATSADTVHLAGTVYFPPADVDPRCLQASGRTRTCLSYGEAHYLDLNVSGVVHPDAAWHWPAPSPLARHLPGWIGFGSPVLLVAEPRRPHGGEATRTCP